ncbi:hypothetical protein [Budvicia aquatica]|uniref:Uncharacterized protein n=1 Tax=Budvicia aquatica TaxID=82979 RepID=A0A2C6DQU8_9GAMM|nr:hypothetical protein [Budvicia aquatica]PHI31063.1 hypothetical protein CRN84_17855 [Budvicia aquatica]VFS51285.1 Uncharacterised protein [Budvicia aquatica]
MSLLDQLTINNLSSLDGGALMAISATQSEASDALLDGISVMGNLAYWAANNPEYSEAKNDLQKLGYSLMVTAEILKALNLNSTCADNALMLRANHEK